MTWTIMADVPNPLFDANGDPYSGAVLKAYLPGTTTSTSIAINSSGGSPQASITANAEGIWEVSGNEIIPFIDRTHKWGIFDNATDAAANTPFYMGPFDNIPQLLSGATTTLFNLGTSGAGTAASSSNPGISVGHIIETNYLDSNLTEGSGSRVAYDGNTTLAKASLWPDLTTGIFHDVDGKHFLLIGERDIRKFGAVTGTNSSAIINAAIASLTTGDIKIPSGTFWLDTQVSLKAGVYLVGEGIASILLQKQGNEMLSTAGSIDTTQGNLLTADGGFGTATPLTLDITAGKGVNFSAGDWALIFSDAISAFPNAINPWGELVRIQSVSTDELTLEGPLIFNYTVANNAEIQPITMIKGLGLKNLQLRNDEPLTYTSRMTEWGFCQDILLENVIVNGNKNAVFLFQGCVGTKITNCSGYDLLSGLPAFGYFVVERGPNLGLAMSDCHTERVRHTYTTGSGIEVAGVTVSQGGQPTGSVISNCTAHNSRQASFDTHEDGYDIKFVGCSALNSGNSGYQGRCTHVSFTECTIHGAIGPGVYFAESANGSAHACTARRTNQGTQAETPFTDWTDKGAYYDAGAKTRITDSKAIESGGPGFDIIVGTNNIDHLYDGCEAIDVGQVATAQGFLNDNIKGVGNPIIYKDCIANGTNGDMDIGFKSSSDVPDLWLDGCYSIGHSTQPISGNYSRTGTRNAGGYISSGLKEVLTLASDTLTITEATTGNITVSGEGATDDDLSTISVVSGSAGDMFFLTKGSGVITFKHGVGNVSVVGGADFIMNNTSDVVLAFRIGTGFTVVPWAI